MGHPIFQASQFARLFWTEMDDQIAATVLYPAVTFMGEMRLFSFEEADSMAHLQAYRAALKQAGVAGMEGNVLDRTWEGHSGRYTVTLAHRYFSEDGRVLNTSRFRLYGEERGGRTGFSMMEFLSLTMPATQAAFRTLAMPA